MRFLPIVHVLIDLPRILPSKIEVSVGSWPAANPVNLERLAKELEETAEAPAIFCSCGSGVSSSAITGNK